MIRPTALRGVRVAIRSLPREILAEHMSPKLLRDRGLAGIEAPPSRSHIIGLLARHRRRDSSE